MTITENKLRLQRNLKMLRVRLVKTIEEIEKLEVNLKRKQNYYRKSK